MRILEIGEGRYLSKFVPGISDFYNISPGSGSEKSLTFGTILALRKKLKAGDYDLVVYHLSVKVSAPWDQNRNLVRVAADIVSASLLHFHKVSWHYFHALCESATPLIVIDTQDVPRLTRTESRWLDRCRFWFMRELPPNHLNLFLNMDRRSGDVINIQRNKALSQNFSKIEPFSLGFNPSALLDWQKLKPSEKIHDVFYSGANHTSTVRQRGLEELRALQAAGLRVFIPEKRLTKQDFFQACAQSWLVCSPEGQGWDCFRHYEALMTYSVPLINLPTIERLWPFKHGEHCLYYRPEAGGLTEAIHGALQNRDALAAIAEQGRAYVLAHHQRSALARHVLEKVGLLSQAGLHWVGV